MWNDSVNSRTYILINYLINLQISSLSFPVWCWEQLETLINVIKRHQFNHAFQFGMGSNTCSQALLKCKAIQVYQRFQFNIIITYSRYYPNFILFRRNWNIVFDSNNFYYKRRQYSLSREVAADTGKHKYTLVFCFVDVAIW